MGKYEQDLFKLIRNSVNPEKSIITATLVIIDFLGQLPPSEVQKPFCPPESV